jgi:AcrR family transcriptional regulator
MGIPERKQRERDERRRLIFDKTKELILEQGLNGFSMQDVARETELSKGTLYLYFENKEALLSALLDEAVGAFLSFVADRISDSMTGIEALRALWSSYMELFGESQDVFIMIGIKNFIDPNFPLNPPTPGEDTDMPHYHLVKYIVSILQRGLDDGTLSTEISAPQIARSVMLIASAIIDHVAKLPRAKRDTTLIQREMRNVFELMLRGLAAPGTKQAYLTLR